ncbi:hypothetical protein [Blastococcus sp. CT_GayMR16]|uniref:hypothetical protein n=1 Tax=Blastococcus sp. CT_GayMR16 TaxID=2559607 RepID=UPI0014312DF2|nr:hypothetical protein [Blastococcus sp. CT_GayMR16]
MSAGLLTGLLVALFGAALATAAPAAAIDDPSRPDSRVTHGPSCRPGGLVVEVVAGTAPYSVRLATTRTPSGEDEATLQPGETVVLRTDDVAWGETIDGRLEFAAQDGTGVTFVDELEEYSFTRPTREDCDAIAAPTAPEPTTTAPPSPSATPTPDGDATPSSSAPPTTTTTTETPAPGGAVPGGGGPATPAPRAVTAGDTVTLQASGFLPGERVTIQMHGSDDILATATAGPDGSVQTEVRIPDGTEAGPATIDMVGADSAVVAPVALQVAADQTPVVGDGAADVVPLTAAAVALVAAVAGLVSVAGRHRGRRHTIRSA